jgi:hypothetical protein
LVAVNVYVVVDAGFADGLEINGSFKLVVGDQLYVVFGLLAVPIIAPVRFVKQVFDMSGPAAAVGGVVFTVTITWSVAEHPFTAFNAVTV